MATTDQPQAAGDRACEGRAVCTCGRGLEEGAAHGRCGTAPLRSLIRVVAAEQGTTAQPFGVTCLLLGFGSLFSVDASGARVTTLSGEVVVEYFVTGPLTEADEDWGKLSDRITGSAALLSLLREEIVPKFVFAARRISTAFGGLSRARQSPSVFISGAFGAELCAS